MTNETELSGEARLKRRNLRKAILFGSLFVVGMALGAGVSLAEDVMDFTFDGPWPREIALATLVVFLLAISVGAWFQHRQMDEHERAISNKAAAVAAMVILVGYPVWFLLWKAGFVPEPTHLAIFVSGYLALYAAYAFYRFR